MNFRNKESYTLLEVGDREIIPIDEIYSALRLSKEFDRKIIIRAQDAAIEMAESYLGFGIKPKKFRLKLTGFLPSVVRLKHKTLAMVEKVNLLYQNDQIEQTLEYEVDFEKNEIDFFFSRILKIAEIDFYTGFINRDTTPSLIKEGLLEHISLIIDGGANELFRQRITKYYQPFKQYRI